MDNPPDWVVQMFGGWDPSKYRWDPYTQNVTDLYTGGSYSFAGMDPSQGSTLVTDYQNYLGNQGQLTDQNSIGLAPGAQPYFGFGDSAQGYDAGLMPNSGIFASTDPNEISDYQSHRDDYVNRGVASVGALVGGAALGGALGGGGAAGADGLTGVTTGGASYLPGGIPAVDAAAAAGWGSSIPTLASLPAAISSPAAISAFTGYGGAGAAGAQSLLDSSGSPIPGTEVPGGSGMPSGLSGLLGGLGDWAPLIGGLLGAVDANNQPDSMSTNTGGTSSSTYGQTIDGQLVAPAQRGLQAIQDLFAQGRQVAGANPTTLAALSQLQNLGSNPFAAGGMNNTAPTTSQFASGAYGNNVPTTSQFANGSMNNTAPTASSFAGGQTINPYLDQVFNTAADSTQNRLATEFAHAGGGALNSGSHQQARSQDLQTLAAGIYAPGFEAERNRQYGAQESSVDRLLAQMEGNLGRQYGATESGLSRLLSQAEGNISRQYGAAESGIDRLLAQMTGNLDRQYGAVEGNLGRDLASIYPMLQGGEYLRNIEQQQYDMPTQGMNQYLAGLQGLLPFFPGTQTQSTTQQGSVTQPLFSNPLAGFLGGAQLGSLFQG